jgi:hypothetical protein
MCEVWRGYDVAGIGGGECTLWLIPRQKVTPLYWRSDTHTPQSCESAQNFSHLDTRDGPGHLASATSSCKVQILMPFFCFIAV